MGLDAADDIVPWSHLRLRQCSLSLHQNICYGLDALREYMSGLDDLAPSAV